MRKKTPRAAARCRKTPSSTGRPVSVLHSKFDVGQLQDLFDGDPFTLVRTVVDNPFVIDLTFPEPRPLTGVTLTTATMDFNAAITLTLASGETQTYRRDFLQTGSDPVNDFPFDPAPSQADQVHPDRNQRPQRQRRRAPPRARNQVALRKQYEERVFGRAIMSWMKPV